MRGKGESGRRPAMLEWGAQAAAAVMEVAAVAMVRQERQEKGGKGREVSRCGSVFRLAAPGGVAQESRAATDGASRMDTSPVNESLPCQEPWRGNVIRPRQVTWRGQTG